MLDNIMIMYFYYLFSVKNSLIFFLFIFIMTLCSYAYMLQAEPSRYLLPLVYIYSLLSSNLADLYIQ